MYLHFFRILTFQHITSHHIRQSPSATANRTGYYNIAQHRLLYLSPTGFFTKPSATQNERLHHPRLLTPNTNLNRKPSTGAEKRTRSSHQTTHDYIGPSASTPVPTVLRAIPCTQVAAWHRVASRRALPRAGGVSFSHGVASSMCPDGRAFVSWWR